MKMLLETVENSKCLFDCTDEQTIYAVYEDGCYEVKHHACRFPIRLQKPSKFFRGCCIMIEDTVEPELLCANALVTFVVCPKEGKVGMFAILTNSED